MAKPSRESGSSAGGSTSKSPKEEKARAKTPHRRSDTHAGARKPTTKADKKAGKPAAAPKSAPKTADQTADKTEDNKQTPTASTASLVPASPNNNDEGSSSSSGGLSETDVTSFSQLNLTSRNNRRTSSVSSLNSVFTTGSGTSLPASVFSRPSSVASDLTDAPQRRRAPAWRPVTITIPIKFDLHEKLVLLHIAHGGADQHIVTEECHQCYLITVRCHNPRRGWIAWPQNGTRFEGWGSLESFDRCVATAMDYYGAWFEGWAVIQRGILYE